VRLGLFELHLLHEQNLVAVDKVELIAETEKELRKTIIEGEY